METFEKTNSDKVDNDHHDNMIIEIGIVACEFLKKNLNVDNAKIIKATRKGDRWEVEVEVYEESSFIKSIGLKTKVQDRNVYLVKFDSNHDVECFERIHE